MAILDWLKQPSTWSMLVMIAGWAGYKLSVGMIQAVCEAIIAVVIAYNLIRKEI